MRALLLILILGLLFSFSIAPDALDLKEAESLGLRWEANGNDNSTHYDYPLSIRFLNTGKESIAFKLPIGAIFYATDTGYQDIVISEEMLLCIGSRKGDPNQRQGLLHYIHQI